MDLLQQAGAMNSGVRMIYKRCKIITTDKP